MAVGEIKPQEGDEEDCEIEEAAILTPAANPGVSGENPEIPGFLETPETCPDNSNLLLKLQGSQETEVLIQQEVSDPHPKVRQSVQRDHLVDNILGSIRRGVTTRSRLANFC
jgi:hypothetical protein